MTVIAGAGAFSHAHIRCLLELGITECVLAKKTPWTNAQQHKFIECHPLMLITFNNDPIAEDKNVHIVTPSNTHAQMLKKYADAKTIFVEKPSVLYNTDEDFTIANLVTRAVYQNDWLAQVQHLRKDKGCPQSIHFTYNVKNRDEIDHITDIWSHAINLLSIWYDPTCEINVHQYKYKKSETYVNVTVNNQTSFTVTTSSGFSETSNWHLRIDNEEFTSHQLGGQLLINTLSTMLTNSDPLTDWYTASWMIHKFRLLQCEDLFKTHIQLYYRN
jgi:hypothetical protein